MLQALSSRWQAFFATAIYAGLRKGELIGLRKAYVDLSARRLIVARSYNRTTTKGGHADSILMMAGANPAAVQRLMRHSDPKLTTEVYGHLAPEYLRAEVDRLKFGVAPAPMEPTNAKAQVANLAPFVPLVSPQSARESEDPDSVRRKPAASQRKTQGALQDSNLGPIGYERGTCSIH